MAQGICGGSFVLREFQRNNGSKVGKSEWNACTWYSVKLFQLSKALSLLKRNREIKTGMPKRADYAQNVPFLCSNLMRPEIKMGLNNNIMYWININIITAETW